MEIGRGRFVRHSRISGSVLAAAVMIPLAVATAFDQDHKETANNGPAQLKSSQPPPSEIPTDGGGAPAGAGLPLCPPPDNCPTPLECLYDGIPNIALGNAQLSLSPPDPTLGGQRRLIVSNIGSSGQDGVAQDPLPAGTTDMMTGIGCPNFAESGPGASAEIRMFANVPVPDGLVSTFTINNFDGDNLVVNADFSPVLPNGDGYTIQTFIGQTMTGNFRGLPSGEVILPRVDLNSMRCFWEGQYYVICYKVTWVVDIAIAGVVVPGDIIYVIVDPPFPCNEQKRIENFFANTGSVEFTYEYAGPTTATIFDCGPGPGSGPCCQANLTPGCMDPEVCACVCQVLPDCCAIQWDMACVAEAQAIGCVTCSGDCCASHATPGCDDPALEACVCSFEPFCCDAAWDDLCVKSIEQFGCGTCQGPCAPDVCQTPIDCVFDGLPNHALGQATLQLNADCNLVVSNIGSSGMDGVTQDPLPPGTQQMVTGIACPNFSQSVMGTQARFFMVGDVPGELISELSVENVDGQMIRTQADFSPVGTTLYTVQIMIGDTLIASFANLPQAVAFVPRVDFNEVDCRIEPTCHISYELTCVVPIQIPGLPPVDGDVVWMIGQNPTSFASVQTRIDNLFANTGPVEMTFQYAGPAEAQASTCGPGPLRGCCFETHPTPGCSEADCCELVCSFVPFCCESVWDEGCVAQAFQLCFGSPPNDDCVNAQLLSIPSVASGNTANATVDNAPFCGTLNTAPGVWYRVIGTGGTITATTCDAPGLGGSADYDTKISVYCGPCDAPSCVTGNDDACTGGSSGLLSTVSWCSAPGVPYLILVHGFVNGTGFFNLSVFDDGVACPDPVTCEPPIGRCCLSDGVPCPGDTNGDGVVNVTDLINVISLWGTNGQAPGIDADLNNDGTVNVLDLIGVITTWGTCPPDISCVEVSGAQCSQLGGDFDATLTCETPCPEPLINDDCQGRILITDGSVPFDLTGATTDGPNEPSCMFPFGGAANQNINQDLWYNYIATATGTLFVDTCGAANLDTRIAVYAGCECPVMGDPVECNDDHGNATEGDTGLDCPGSLEASLSLPVLAGECYKIRVGAFSTSGTVGGTDVLNVICVPIGSGD